jgi:hypothetical protein
MASSQQPKGRDAVITTLDLFVQALTIVKHACGIPPAQVAFSSTNVLSGTFPPILRREIPDSRCLGYDGKRPG